MRPAHARDVRLLVNLMREFYAESGHELDEGTARSAFEALLHDPGLGRVWLVDRDSDAVTAAGSTTPSRMAAAGPVVVIDDFLVRRAMRGEGLATATLADVYRACEALGIRAMRVEAGLDNVAARAVYQRAGLGDVDHGIMETALAPVPGR